MAKTSNQFTFSLPELRVRTSPSPDSEQEWMERVATSALSFLESLVRCANNLDPPHGYYSGTSPASFPVGQNHLAGDRVPFTAIEAQLKKRLADQKNNREAVEADNEQGVRRYRR